MRNIVIRIMLTALSVACILGMLAYASCIEAPSTEDNTAASPSLSQAPLTPSPEITNNQEDGSSRIYLQRAVQTEYRNGDMLPTVVVKTFEQWQSMNEYIIAESSGKLTGNLPKINEDFFVEYMLIAGEVITQAACRSISVSSIIEDGGSYTVRLVINTEPRSSREPSNFIVLVALERNSYNVLNSAVFEY